MKFALVAPEGTVTLEGTVATAVLPLVNETTVPPDGAPLLRVTVPSEVFPPTTLAGLRLTEDRAGPDPPDPVTVMIAGATTPR